MRTALLALTLSFAPAPSGEGALGQLVAAVSAEVQTAQDRGPLCVTVSAPGHPGLEEAFSTLLLAKLSSLGLEPRLLPSSTEAEAQARQSGARALVRVRLGLDASRLTASGDVLSTWVNFFSAPQVREATPASVLFSRVAADEAVRALAGRPEATGLVLEPLVLARWPVRTAALAAGALLADARLQLAVLTEEAVEVRALDGRLLARRTLEGLPLAEAPPREAFGTLCICEGLLYAFSARRAEGEVLAYEGGALVVRAPLHRPVVACGGPPVEAAFLPGAARLLPSGPGWPLSPPLPAAWGFSVRPSASGPVWLLLLEDGTARTGSAGVVRSLKDVGAGAALLDAATGEVRVAASSAQAFPSVDRLVLLSARDASEGASVEVPGRILQVAAASLEKGGPEVLLLGVWGPEGTSELRLVRGRP